MSIDRARLRQVDMLALIGQDTYLKKVASTRGGEYAGPCPFCGGRDRFRVHPEQGRWWCRNWQKCTRKEGWRDAADYLIARDWVTFPEACRALGLQDDNRSFLLVPQLIRKPPPAPPEDGPPSPAWQQRAQTFATYAQKQLWGPDGTRALAYLREHRGLTDGTIKTHGLGFNPRAWEDMPQRWGVDGKPIWLPRGIVIPCRAGGQTWYIKVRRPRPGDELAACIGSGKGDHAKYLMVRGSRPALFGADALRKQQVAVLTEGEFDAILLGQQAGDLAGVATLGSAAMKLTGRWLSLLMNFSCILAAYDLDGAGRRGAQGLLGLSDRIHLAPPVGTDDLTAMHQAGADLRTWLRYYLAKRAPRAGAASEQAAPAPQPAAPARSGIFDEFLMEDEEEGVL